MGEYRQPLGQSAQRRLFGVPCDAANQTAATLPILGKVTVHRLAAPQLERILGSILHDGLAAHIDRGDYGGIYNCRQMRSGGGYSKHSWATAIDLNYHEGPDGERDAPINYGRRGEFPHLRRLLPYFVAEGWSAGLQWQRVPDPMHFEATTAAGTGLLSGGTLRGIDLDELPLTAADLGYLAGYADLRQILNPARRVWRFPGGEVGYELQDGRATVLVADVARAMGWTVETDAWPTIVSKEG